jgi:hypothetical protein
MRLRGINYDIVHWIQLDQGRGQFHVHGNDKFHDKTSNLLTSCLTVSFLRTTVHCGVNCLIMNSAS